MKVENWTMEEQGKRALSKWAICYRLLNNPNVMFVTKEYQPESNEPYRFLIVITKNNSYFPNSLDTSVLVSEIERYFPGCTNSILDNSGFGLVTNNLTELFQWVETFKVALDTLYQKYGLDLM